MHVIAGTLCFQHLSFARFVEKRMSAEAAAIVKELERSRELVDELILALSTGKYQTYREQLQISTNVMKAMDSLGAAEIAIYNQLWRSKAHG